MKICFFILNLNYSYIFRWDWNFETGKAFFGICELFYLEIPN